MAMDAFPLGKIGEQRSCIEFHGKTPNLCFDIIHREDHPGQKIIGFGYSSRRGSKRSLVFVYFASELGVLTPLRGYSEFRLPLSLLRKYLCRYSLGDELA